MKTVFPQVGLGGLSPETQGGGLRLDQIKGVIGMCLWGTIERCIPVISSGPEAFGDSWPSYTRHVGEGQAPSPRQCAEGFYHQIIWKPLSKTGFICWVCATTGLDLVIPGHRR